MDSVGEPVGDPRGERPAAGSVTSTIDAAVAIDRDWAIVDFSPAAEQLFGLPRAAAIGHDLVGLIVPEPLRDSVRNCLAAAANVEHRRQR